MKQLLLLSAHPVILSLPKDNKQESPKRGFRLETVLVATYEAIDCLLFNKVKATGNGGAVLYLVSGIFCLRPENMVEIRQNRSAIACSLSLAALQHSTKTTFMSHSLLFVNQSGEQRSKKYLDTDKAALQAVLQACVNVELFTIPLYMTALYSIQGTHAINSKGNDFYKGRLWPGAGLTAQPKTANERAFNSVFSVFVAEMLHLQLASNMCNAAGYTPTFTGAALVNDPNDPATAEAAKKHPYGWHCYGANNTVLPHILDFKDTLKPQIRVNVGPLDKTQTELFLIIEETEEAAHGLFEGDKIPDRPEYDTTVPFKTWGTDPKTRKLPYFSSIGSMYLRLWEYLSLEYDEVKPAASGDGGTAKVEYMQLWDYVYADTQKAGSLFQQEVFNTGDANTYEYPTMTTHINQADADNELLQIMNMINGITDQGEGDGVIKLIKERLLREHAATGKNAQPMLQKVLEHYQPSRPNLERKYPSYDESGKPLPESAQANARTSYNPHMPGNGAMDHFEIFTEIMTMLNTESTAPGDRISTWADWHADQANKWTKEMLEVAGVENNYPALPATADIAQALNNLKEKDADGANFRLFSHTAAGSIAGVTTVLDNYFNRKYPKAEFPYPSMSGSGDRMGICWAIFGKAPELWLGMLPRTQPGIPDNEVLFHACQGMSLIGADAADNCASTPVFHSCKSSNMCKTEGGCGFVQSTTGGSGCGAPKNFLYSGDAPGAGANLTQKLYTTPANNNCGGLGGCAVPISAAQMYPAMNPKPGDQPSVSLMVINNYTKEYPYEATEIRRVGYEPGKLVYDTAWDAFAEVLKARGEQVPAKPKPSDLRLAFPPST
ncbi:MAG: hypothetical protein EOO15_17875 [Chitinophagaceae bacterium]|nr:MAG: hypothetical protein EOO15_17875 [Chitinophagaceae bacterium]